MRKALSVILASAMVLSLAACTGSNQAETTAAPTETAKAEAPADTTSGKNKRDRDSKGRVHGRTDHSEHCLYAELR